jgi:hypothetical protein
MLREEVLKDFYPPVFFLSATKPIICVSHSVTIDWDRVRYSFHSLARVFSPLLLHIPFVPCHSKLQIVHVSTHSVVTRYCYSASGSFNSCLVQSWTMSELKALQIHETQFPLFAPLWNYNGMYVFIRKRRRSVTVNAVYFSLW